MSGSLLRECKIIVPYYDNMCPRQEMIDGLLIMLANALTLQLPADIESITENLNIVTSNLTAPFFFWAEDEAGTLRPVPIPIPYHDQTKFLV